eukprot:2311990-Prymnesium_polylepis.2
MPLRRYLGDGHSPCHCDDLRVMPTARATASPLWVMPTAPRHHARCVAFRSRRAHKIDPPLPVCSASDFDDLQGAGRWVTPWRQYYVSKAGLCSLMRALNIRFAKAGVNGSASVADAGLAATGLNVQSDLA